MYVPLNFYFLYKRGVFSEAFTFGEAKYIVRIMLFMHLIDCAGHMAFKYWTTDTYNRHIRLDPLQVMKLKKQELDNYITQKEFFKSKKEGRN